MGSPRYPQHFAWEALEIAALRQADLAIGLTELIIDESAKRVGVGMPPTRLLPCFFDPSHFPARRSPPPAGPLRVLFVGRLEPRKGVDLALKALASARDAGVDAELTVLGRDDIGYRAELDALCERLELRGVRFVEETDERGVVEHLHRSHCALLPSRFDNSHLAAVEALSCGVPVITTDRTGIASWFRAEEGVQALPLADEERFAALAGTAVRDERWLASAGMRGAERVRELFDPAATARQLLGWYEELVAARRGSTRA
jgi:glycosyltransferase involved in cell wall biosynthesis